MRGAGSFARTRAMTMADSVERWLRVLGTGFSFAVFGLLSLVVGYVYAPIVALVSRREQRELRVQRFISRVFRFFVRLMEGLGLIVVDTHRADELADPEAGLVIANHPTLIDTVLLVAMMPQAYCVVKKEHWSSPFLAGVMRGAGYIPNDGGEQMVDDCSARIRAGKKVLLFPEGTRSPRGQLGPFHRGAAHVALAAGVPALPVSIQCEPAGLMRDQPWYDVPSSPMNFSLQVGEPIQTGLRDGPRSRVSRQLTAEYRELFAKRLHAHA